MSTRFFTNTADKTLLQKFAGVFTHNPDIEWFDALVGYLRTSGYFAIRPHLEKCRTSAFSWPSTWTPSWRTATSAGCSS